MDEKFESQLNEKARSSYQVKTTSGQILSAYHAKQAEKKAPSYKGWFFASLGAFASAVIVLAVYVPLSLNHAQESVPASSSISYTDINVSPLKGQANTLTYEVNSLYPLLKKAESATTLGLRQSLRRASEHEKEVFEDAVDSYEELQAPIHDTLLGTNENLSVETGTFSGQKAVYANAVDLPDVGRLLFNAETEGNSWKTLSGELQDEEGALYTIDGRNNVNGDNSDLFLSLTGEDGFYCTVQQNAAKGLFYFSFEVYRSHQLDSAFSLSLVQWEQTKPAVIAQYFFADDYQSGTFNVVKESDTVFSIYGTPLNKILLTYKNSERTYSYSNLVKTED